jgi:hypothetical protein
VNPGPSGFPAPILLLWLRFGLVGFGYGQGFIDVVMGAVDVVEDASLEAASIGIVFFMSYVLMGLAQQVAGLVQVAAPGEVSVDRFVFVDVLAVVDGSLLDFVDGLVDFLDGLMLFDVNGAAVGTMLEMGASVPQIRKSVEVSGMLALSVNVA